MRGLGSDNIDFRLRQWDFRADGVPVAVAGHVDRAMQARQRAARRLLPAQGPAAAVGASARGDQARLQGQVLHAVDNDLLMPVANKVIVRPGEWVQALCQIAVAIAAETGQRAPVDGVAAEERAKLIAASLLTGERKAILLGNAAVRHPEAVQLRAWAQWIAERPAPRSVYWVRLPIPSAGMRSVPIQSRAA